VLCLDAFQVDYGVVAAAAVLAVDGQLLADDLSYGADLGWLGGLVAGTRPKHSRLEDGDLIQMR
jgi:hypothetical protein